MLATLSLFNGRTTLPEILWTLMGFIGIWVNQTNFKEAQLDLRALELNNMNGLMKRIAHHHIRREVLRGIVNMTVAIIGLYAMSQPALVPSQPISSTSIVLTVGLFIIVGVSIGNSYLDKMFRMSLLKGE